MDFILKRKYLPSGTNGELFHGGQKIGHTIELPWLNNRPQVSCIPEGRYPLHLRFTTRFGWHCLVQQVTGRSAILIHAFNHALTESRGCIAPVMKIEGEGRGSSSRAALEKFIALVRSAFDRGESIYLIIQKQEL